MQNERGTLRTLTCKDVISKSVPALCTTSLISGAEHGAVHDRGGISCLSDVLDCVLPLFFSSLHFNMASCTFGQPATESMQSEEDLKSFKQMVSLFPPLRNLCFSKKKKSPNQSPYRSNSALSSSSESDSSLCVIYQAGESHCSLFCTAGVKKALVLLTYEPTFVCPRASLYVKPMPCDM